MTIYKDIKGYEGLYKISKAGKVKSMPRNGTLGGVLRPDCFSTYEQVALFKNNSRKVCKVHRLVALAFIPNPNNYPYVCHKNGDPRNNNATNLYWGTPQMNMDDKKKHGTWQGGENHWKCKLTEKDVLTIRELSETNKKSYSKLSKMYNVSKSHIGLMI